MINFNPFQKASLEFFDYGVNGSVVVVENAITAELPVPFLALICPNRRLYTLPIVRTIQIDRMYRLSSVSLNYIIFNASLHHSPLFDDLSMNEIPYRQSIVIHHPFRLFSRFFSSFPALYPSTSHGVPLRTIL